MQSDPQKVFLSELLSVLRWVPESAIETGRKLEMPLDRQRARRLGSQWALRWDEELEVKTAQM